MTVSRDTEAGRSRRSRTHQSGKSVELLAPAGDFEKLEIAIHYGADAVYLSDDRFSLRNFARNFTVESLPQAVAYAHERGVKVYVACNLPGTTNWTAWPNTWKPSAASVPTD